MMIKMFGDCSEKKGTQSVGPDCYSGLLSSESITIICLSLSCFDIRAENYTVGMYSTAVYDHSV